MGTTLCAILCNLYVSLGAAHLAGVNPPPCEGCAWYSDITRPLNPYGIAAIGWETPQWRGLSGGLEVRHMSSMGNGHDQGQNSIEARVRWRPFGGAR